MYRVWAHACDHAARNGDKMATPRPLAFPFRSALISPWTPLRDGLPLQQLPTQFRPGSGDPIVLLGASFHHPRAGFEGPEPGGQRFRRDIFLPFPVTTPHAMTHKERTVSTPEEELSGSRSNHPKYVF